ncbi:MAG: hypothetical protein EPN21_17510 [Methylococcaceae bacterium]|nr:MAG: hypothetical protein EPN21_17510 [Methylococcaceae bacterium]
MWMLFLCVFPPLFSGEMIDLNIGDATMKTSFHVPVEKIYPLDITFEFPSVEARLSDQIVGDRYNEDCNGDIRYEEIPEIRRTGLGRPIPFRIVVRKKADESIVLDRTIVSLCITSHGGKDKVRTIGYLPLAIGDYVAEVMNLEKQAGLAGVKTTIGLYGGHGK